MADVPTARVAVVTGGAGAIGGAIARELARLGHRVVVLDRTGDVVCDLASEAGRTGGPPPRSWRGTAGSTCSCTRPPRPTRWSGRPPASPTGGGSRPSTSSRSQLLAQAFVPGMQERGFGRIVLITSDTVWRPPTPDLLGYITSKGALTAFGRTLATALGKDGIAVTSVAPGLTRTPATAYQPDEAFDAALATQALPRPLVPETTSPRPWASWPATPPRR
ncbi:SDR family NAD(P)-dependent oxidoreductase [Streptomyces sp. L7]